MTDIDIEARQHASAIATGADPEIGVGPKETYYGLVGRLLFASQLDMTELRNPAPTFSGLCLQLHNVLSRRLRLAYLDQPRETRSELEASAFEHTAKVSDDPSFINPWNRIDAGIQTALVLEMMTLRTIARKQASGERVSLDGLYKSKRVPFAFAMTHMTTLAPSLEGKVEQWLPPNENTGDVLRNEAVRLSQHGLSLTEAPIRDLKDEFARMLYGPVIGCPVTLIKGAVDTIHRTAVDATLESGLLTAS